MSHEEAPPSATPTVTFSSGQSSSQPDLRLLHYNDVYHLDPSSAEPVGGISRFITVCREYQNDEKFQGQPKLVTLFSGDVFNPSLESSVTKGSHMVPFLNSIGTDCACVGNHDLDFGVKQFRHLTSKCNFPWLLANVLDPALGKDVPLGNAKRTHMLTSSNGIKIGLIGLGEREWLETINSLPPNLIYRSATEVARELVPQLRAEGAEIIIALTHQREPNDNKLAENMAGELDLILGGHDHFYAHSLINGTHVLRSGSDFKQLSYLEARRSTSRPGRWDVDIWRRDMVKTIPEDAEAVALANKLTAKLKKSLEKPVGWTAAPLDARFTTVRLKESNLGNLVCDIMSHHYSTDCAIMASGTIRGDQIYAPGPIRVKDVTDCFPFEDPVVVIRATGKAILEALENGVSLYPALEGRFPQVAKIKFTFDPSKPVGSRILSAELGGQPLDMEHAYTIATRGYMGRGKDGYKSLLVKSEGGECDEIVSEENGILISMMLRQYFMALKVMGQWKNWGPSMDRHWGRVVDDVGKSHPTVAPKPPGSSPVAATHPSQDAATSDPKRKASWDEWTPAKLRARKSGLAPLGNDPEDSSSSSSEDEEAVSGKKPSNDVKQARSNGPTTPGARQAREAASTMDRELTVMRRFARKWCQAAGVMSQCVDSLGDEELVVDWTKAVAPRVEGRILMVGGGGSRDQRTKP